MARRSIAAAASPSRRWASIGRRAAEPMRLIRDGDAVGGFLGIGFTAELISALGERSLQTVRPRNLTLICPVA
jgi:acyl CoA:acetate/3-ketoacid CoA transferase